MPRIAPRIDTQYFRSKLHDRRMSQRELGRAIGLDSAAVSLTLRGLRTMKIAEAAAIAKMLGVPAEEVMAHAGVAIGSGHQRLTISGYIDGQGEAHSIKPEEAETIPHPGGSLPEAIGAFECRTAGSVIDFMDGWLLFVAPPIDGVMPDAIGKFSICRLDAGVTMLATPKHSRTRGKWDITGPTIRARAVSLSVAFPVLAIQP